MNKVEVRLIEWVETSVGVDDITTAVRHTRTLGLSSRRRQNCEKKWMKGFRNNQVRRKGKKIQKGLRRFGERRGRGSLHFRTCRFSGMTWRQMLTTVKCKLIHRQR